jgi:hypothetical protein
MVTKHTNSYFFTTNLKLNNPNAMPRKLPSLYRLGFQLLQSNVHVWRALAVLYSSELRNTHAIRLHHCSKLRLSTRNHILK